MLNTSDIELNRNLKIIVGSSYLEHAIFKEHFVGASNHVKFISESKLEREGDGTSQAISGGKVQLEFVCSEKGLSDLIHSISLVDFIDPDNNKANILESMRITHLAKPLSKTIGMGRIGYLTEPKRLFEVVEMMKAHLKMETIRLAIANGRFLKDEISSIAVCAGSGSKLLNNLNADLLITGEFSHHEILHEVNRGTSVILTDHSNTERGFSALFKKKFTELLEKNNERIDIEISQIDRDPLEYI